MKVKFLKKSKYQKFSALAPVAKGALATLVVLMDDQTAVCTVMGEDAAGNPVDISTVASLTPAPTSDTPTVLTAGPVTGNTFPITAVAPGSANITVTATWNDGSIGPFTATLPVTVTAGPATGLIINVGTPTVTG